jgi:hypothetical protein
MFLLMLMLLLLLLFIKVEPKTEKKAAKAVSEIDHSTFNRATGIDRSVVGFTHLEQMWIDFGRQEIGG